MATNSQTCPQCGKPLPSNAPAGLCPSCIMAMNMATQTEFTGEVGPHGTKVLKQTPAPAPSELAEKFPQLEIIELLGRGGMGAVYKARQKELDRIVALKILPPGIGNDPSFAERFAREARALAKLNHPNIVTLYEFGRADGLFFFLMEFVDGVNLGQLLQRGRISSREALAIVPQICDALQYAHDQGIVHRDIKPENVLMDRRGRVKVADFGLAKLMGADTSLGGAPSTGTGLVKPEMETPALTDAGKVMGTPQYMAPEQMEKPLEVDHRADIYALGVVFYQMLTGELPGKRIEPPSKKVQIDVRLDEIVLRALEKDPLLRFEQASVLKTQVETIVASDSTGERQSHESEAKAPQPTALASRLSRTAVAGVCCWGAAVAAAIAILFITAKATLLATQTAGMPSSARAELAHSWSISVVVLIIAQLVAIGGVLAGTILGWISIVRIRRSDGRLYGLGLALGCALPVPLLLVSAMIVAVGGVARLGLVEGLLLSIPVDVIVAWWLCRKLRRNKSEAGGDMASVDQEGRGGWKWAVVLGLILMAGAFLSVRLLMTGGSGFATSRPNGGLAATNQQQIHSVRTPPFVAHYRGGTVELLALAPHPSTNGQAWLPTGAPFTGQFPFSNGKNQAAGHVMKEIAFRIRTETESVSHPVTRFEPSSVGGMGSSVLPYKSGSKERIFVQAIACPPQLKQVNVRIGIADGDWQAIETLDAGADKLHGDSQSSGEDGSWRVQFQMVKGDAGDVALSFAYSRREEWETRMVAVKNDGSTRLLSFNNSDADMHYGLISISEPEFSQVTAIQLQRRKYQWMVFHNVALEQGPLTAIEIADALEVNTSGEKAFREVFGEAEKSTARPGLSESIELEAIVLQATNLWNWLTPSSYESVIQDKSVKIFRQPYVKVPSGQDTSFIVRISESPVSAKKLTEWRVSVNHTPDRDAVRYSVKGHFSKTNDVWISPETVSEDSGRVNLDSPIVLGLSARNEEPGTALVLMFRPVWAASSEPRADYKITLTNGMSFEVVAICRNPRETNLWWKPDGTPFAKPPYEIVNLPELGPTRSSKITVNPKNEFLVFIRRQSPPDWPTDVQQSFGVEWAPSPSDLEFPPTIRDAVTGKKLSAHLICFENVPDTVDYKTQVARGPWESIAIFDGKRTRELVNGVMVACSAPAMPDKRNDYQFEVMHNVDRETYSMRLIAKFKNGGSREVDFHPGPLRGNPSKGFAIIHPDDFDPAAVTEYVLERARLDRGEIKGISLKPRMQQAVHTNRAAQETNSVAYLISAMSTAVAKIEKAIEAGLLVEMDNRLNSINEYCDQLQGKNGNIAPSPKDWDVDAETHGQILKLLARMENDAEGMRSLAHHTKMSEEERVAMMKRVWIESFQKRYQEMQTLLKQR